MERKGSERESSKLAELLPSLLVRVRGLLLMFHQKKRSEKREEEEKQERRRGSLDHLFALGDFDGTLMPFCELSSQNPSALKGNSVLHTSDLFADFSLIIHLKKLLRFTVDIICGQRKGFNFQSGDAKNNHLVTSLLLSSGFWSDYLSSMGTSAIRGLPKW
ncbi:uncharacterized protein LOC131244190 [Magnolia sinica]|uniref:uncharacterized protein LOC131244190 n=1 Tax=Magnolia sinica TaxID=86752 RepID=UPI00265A65BC|nr:uncharacterized protein LOC131244190 [Magnolia sinica]